MATKRNTIEKKAEVPLDPPNENTFRIDTSRFKASAIAIDNKSLNKLSLTFLVPASKVPPSSEAGETKFFGHFPVTQMAKKTSIQGRSFRFKKTRVTARLDILDDEGAPSMITIEFSLKDAKIKTK